MTSHRGLQGSLQAHHLSSIKSGHQRDSGEHRAERPISDGLTGGCRGSASIFASTALQSWELGGRGKGAVRREEEEQGVRKPSIVDKS